MESKHNDFFSIDRNALTHDDERGVVAFDGGLVITDDSEQRNGTRYDIPTMDLSEYKGQITADHSMSITETIGKVFGLRKDANKVTIDGIKFAVKENALARFAYDMLKGGFLTDFSIETYGPMPDEEGVYRDAKLIGLSLVNIGNNRSASLNQLALNSLEEAKKDGLDTTAVENILNIEISEEGGEDTMKEEKTEVEVDETDTEETDEVEEVEAPKGLDENSIKQLEAVMNKLVAPMTAKLNELEEKVFNNSAKEPEFKKATTKVDNSYKNTNWRERHALQINHAWDYLKGHDMNALTKLQDINKYNLEQLQESGIVANTMTIADFGNFVISRELLSEIEGHRSNFQPLLSRADWRETTALQMAWLVRSGDINMTEVEMCDDGADGNLKPISEYTAGIETADLHELAAVTPVCNAATRFLVADILGDVAAGYRTDYDRKRAQLMIAKMEQAVESTGNSITYGTTSDAASLQGWLDTWIEAQEEIMNGVFIFNQKTYGQLLSAAIGAGISGPLAGLFTTGDQPLIAGSPYIVVPNELLPTLNTAETKTFTVDGVNVTVNHAVFYLDLSTFTGRTSGGLQYDLSTEAAYEIDNSVRSAFQRNELVLRGSFFRNGAIKDENKVAGLLAPGVS